jgi:hypothetical protein
LLSTLNFSMDIRRVWAYWSWGRAFWTSKYTLVSFTIQIKEARNIRERNLTIYF